MPLINGLAIFSLVVWYTQPTQLLITALALSCHVLSSVFKIKLSGKSFKVAFLDNSLVWNSLSIAICFVQKGSWMELAGSQAHYFLGKEKFLVYILLEG